jgi:lipoprotein NlpD
MNRKKQSKTFWNRIRFKYKLSFFNESTLEEVWNLRLSQLTGFITLFIFTLFLIILTSIIIIKTPIRNYLPGYLDVEVRKEILQNALRADSLEDKLTVQSRYLDNLLNILTGNIQPDMVSLDDSAEYIKADYNIAKGKAEENYVKRFEEEEKYNLTALNPNPTHTKFFFHKPLNGIISSAFNVEKSHFGIDLTAAPKENVLATLDGTVIYTGFDPMYGNVITIQHRNDFISMYKHNNIILKGTGDHVVAGEAIAIIGNTGKLSTGIHLHFELWHRGIPVNPEEYIAF